MVCLPKVFSRPFKILAAITSDDTADGYDRFRINGGELGADPAT